MLEFIEWLAAALRQTGLFGVDYGAPVVDEAVFVSIPGDPFFGPDPLLISVGRIVGVMAWEDGLELPPLMQEVTF